MRQFLRFFLASCLGVCVAIFLLIGIGSLVMVQIASSADAPKEVKANSILKISLNEPVPEKTNNLEMDVFDFKNQKTLGLKDIIDAIEVAKDDDNIKGIYLDTDALGGFGFATTRSLRNAIQDFQESGKFVIAYSKYYTQGAYYIASVSDKIYLNPIGLVDFRGFSAQIPFLKEMFDKVGIKWQVFYAGKFKSATEPYRRTEMSEEYKFQVREYLDQMYHIFLEDISQSRNISIENLKTVANGYLASDPQKALEYRMIDVVGYEDEMKTEIRQRLGLEEEEKISLISLKEYFRSNPPDKDYSVKKKIAVIYAEGPIIDGKGEPGSVGDKQYVDIINGLIDKDNIDAVVLRVNSPGGSAMASENIWRALTRLKESGKPLVVSFGDYAASGGYYISCIGDSIFAEPNTLTGSIGVFSMIPSAQELLNQKLGIRFDSVKTGDLSTGITPFYDLGNKERMILQNRTDKFYNIFKQRVADGRGMTMTEVDEVGQGRVWTGNKALELGLVDRIGGLDDALSTAANLAGIEEYRLAEYPKVKDPIQQLIEEFTGSDDTGFRTAIRSEFSDWYPYYKYISDIKDTKGVQARLPFIIPFN